MIIKGGPRGKGRELAAHLMRADTNEKVRVFDTRGVFSKTVRGALAEMEAVAAGSKATKPLYHVSINPEADEALTPAQWLIAADRLEKALGMEGHQRVMVQHLKHGRTHMHIAWCRIDIETMKAAHHSHNYRTHEEVARSLEKEFGLKRTQGVHAERDTEKEKPRQRPATHESQMEARTGWKKADAQAAILSAWTKGGDGATFTRALEAQGYRLAQGDRRDYVVVDPAGGVHSLRSGVKGLRVAEIRDRFADLDGKTMPTVTEAKKAAQEAYPAFLEVRSQAERQPAQTPSLKPPTMSYRPTAPKPGRYEVLRSNTTAGPESTPHQHQPSIKPPQPVPTLPSWARNAAPEPTPSRPAKAGPTVALQSATQQLPSSALQELNARQLKEWLATLARIGQGHDKALGSLDDHHTKRLTTISADVDARLKELNGISSRAGALFNPADRDREIAYLVAKRQRSLAEEKARQEQVKDDLRRAHAREIEEAKAKHDRLAALQQQMIHARDARTAENSPRPSKTRTYRDFER